MLSVLHVLLLVFSSRGAPQPLQEADSSPARTEACTTCSGTGRVRGECWVCLGARKHACVECARFRPAVPEGPKGVWLPSSVRELLDQELKRAMSGIGKVKLPKLGPLGKGPKPVELRPGDVRCPARCRGGELLLVSDWVDCRVCRSGKFRCPACRRGKVKCATCRRSGKSEVACEDCAGSGRLPDASDTSVDACPWCGGSAERACGACDGGVELRATCPRCLGATEVTCEKCRGIELIPCKTCGGRGRHGLRKEKCETCDGEGGFPCRACDDGLELCACTDAGAPPPACAACSGEKELPCSGCAAGAYRAWEVASALLREAGDDAGAAAWLAEARARCERRYAQALEHLARVARSSDAIDDDAHERYRRAAERERDDELRRLERLAR